MPLQVSPTTSGHALETARLRLDTMTTMKKQSIWDYKNIHMTGVKGVGMTALAQVLLANGFAVDGSDVSETFMTDAVLKELGIAATAFDAKHVRGKDAVIRSNAYASTNPEVAAAEQAGMPLFSYPEVVAELFNAHYGVAIAGSHGKTTTTAMLAHILKYARKNVTAIVGSRVENWHCGALAGDLSKQDALFVLEADEYKEAFLYYRPKAAIITNIDYDHPDYFATPKEYAAAFGKFIKPLPSDGFLVVNADDAALCDAARLAACRVIFVSGNAVQSFNLRTGGDHNVMNANMAYQAALALGVSREVAADAFADFQGTARRMELVGENNGALIYDDYAHHPSEIKATLAALKQKYPAKRIIAVFQPHTYSRTKALFVDFAGAFADADSVILTDIYASAREQKDDSVNMAEMVRAINHKGKDAILIKNKENIASYVKRTMSADDVVVTLGAGDIGRVLVSLAKG